MSKMLLKSILFLVLVFSFSYSPALTIQGNNLVTINSIPFHLNLTGDKRIAENSYVPLSFTVSQTQYPDSICILYTSIEMDLTVTFQEKHDLGALSFLAEAKADFKQEIYLHELRLSLDFLDPLTLNTLKGVEAINENDESFNKNLIPYTDKVIQYNSGSHKFWIVASNYEQCKNVETLTSNEIVLYDYQSHFFRVFNTNTNQTDLLRDTMYQPAGNEYEWSFLIFEEKPFLLNINRWPYGKKAALSITNDADGETADRLKAVYLGSNNASNPKYLTQGFAANHIKASNTVFGTNFATLADTWQMIMDNGNSIGYHTYANLADPAGTNAGAMLGTLTPYDIRLWIDHGLPTNPEDIGYNGLNPASANYVADIINQSQIDYIWPADTPPTNPFNSYEETWRLPHIQFEAKSLNRPIWFFGRARQEAWEYLNGWSMLCMKYQMTTENLDRLIQERGLHVSYTHFCFNNSAAVVSFFIIADNGDYEIRPEVNDMLELLDFYQQYKGLWIETVENIFDRMLAIEQIRVIGVQSTAVSEVFLLTLANDSNYDLQDVNFSYQDQFINIPFFAANSVYPVNINGKTDESASPGAPNYRVYYQNRTLYLKDTESSVLAPVEIDVFNIRGQKVLTKQYSGSQMILDIPFAGKASGLYFMRIKQVTGKTSTLKFTVLK